MKTKSMPLNFSSTKSPRAVSLENYLQQVQQTCLPYPFNLSDSTKQLFQFYLKFFIQLYENNSHLTPYLMFFPPF